MTNDLTLGEKGAVLIKHFEDEDGPALEAFLPTPDDVPTIGWGHTRGVAMGDTCTKEQAEAWFAEDVKWAEDCVNRAVNVALSQGEFDSLTSLAFNIGCKNFSGSTLVKLLNAGDYDGAAKEFSKWNKQGKNVLAGLTRRREAEKQLFEGSFT